MGKRRLLKGGKKKDLFSGTLGGEVLVLQQDQRKKYQKLFQSEEDGRESPTFVNVSSYGKKGNLVWERGPPFYSFPWKGGRKEGKKISSKREGKGKVPSKGRIKKKSSYQVIYQGGSREKLERKSGYSYMRGKRRP